MTTYFITRHRGALKWKEHQAIEAVVADHLDPRSLSRGDIVIGNVPFHVAAEVCARGARFFSIDLDVEPGQRGRALSLKAMLTANARLVEYQVTRKSAAAHAKRSRKR